jgi:hypothetical protein
MKSEPVVRIEQSGARACASLVVCLFWICSLSATVSKAQTLKPLGGKEGFWRLAVEEGPGQIPVYYFISPDGKKEFMNTVTSVEPSQTPRSGEGYRSQDWDGRNSPQDRAAWAAAESKRVKASGFKGLGAWCDHALEGKGPDGKDIGIPMSRDLNLIWTLSDKGQHPFSPEFEQDLDKAKGLSVPAVKTKT